MGFVTVSRPLARGHCQNGAAPDVGYVPGNAGANSAQLGRLPLPRAGCDRTPESFAPHNAAGLPTQTSTAVHHADTPRVRPLPGYGATTGAACTAPLRTAAQERSRLALIIDHMCFLKPF